MKSKNIFRDWWKKMTPKQFVETVFEEDFIGLEYDEHLREQSETYYDDLDEEFEKDS